MVSSSPVLDLTNSQNIDSIYIGVASYITCVKINPTALSNGLIGAQVSSMFSGEVNMEGVQIVGNDISTETAMAVCPNGADIVFSGQTENHNFYFTVY